MNPIQKPKKTTVSPLGERYLAAKRALFDTYYGARLNPEQRSAVFCAKGPLLVLAGAGSGKTTVLVNRISYLICYGNAYESDEVPEDLTEERVLALEAAAGGDPEEIAEILPEFITEPCPPYGVLAITFTNKAAREIRERIAKSFEDPEVSEAITAGTFHSACVRILHRFGERIGYPQGFSIYDTDDKKRMLEICMKELGIDDKNLSVKTVASMISAAKDKLLSPDELEDETNDPRLPLVRKVYELYERKMLSCGAMDFDDLIMKTVRLLEEHGDVLSYYQRKFRHVLVDEYQDTNYAQFRLTELLSGGYRNIMVVGDDDQSIYRFRGATVENILNFDKTYPDARVVKLEQNYRSTENILNAANAVIAHNESRHQKSLWSDRGAGEKITVFRAEDAQSEARYIVQSISREVHAGGRKCSDFAVLYRLNELSRALEGAFAKSGIPYVVIGSHRFFDRKEVRDMVAYLSLAGRSTDDLRFLRVINEPKRKIGDATVAMIRALADQVGVPMFEIASHAGEYPVLEKSAGRLLAFSGMIFAAAQKSTLPSAVLEELFETSGYRAMLQAEAEEEKKDGGIAAEERIANVQELINAALEYEKRCEESGEEPGVSGFLEEIALVSDADRYDENSDAVSLMTIHSAKGLEFPCVFLSGMEDGIFPSQQNLGREEEMSEERRLCYVAITRAKEKLTVTYAQARKIYDRTNYGRLSAFIREEIPKDLIEEDRPKAAPPRAPLGYSPTAQSYERRQPISAELRRPSEISQTGDRAKNFGIERLPVGQRVRHPVFGEGEILSLRDLGGDILYEVRFDTGETKKLMATFAKLTKI